jgi:hypothetical protein
MESQYEKEKSSRDFLAVSKDDVVPRNPSECSLVRKREMGHLNSFVCSSPKEIAVMKQMIAEERADHSFDKQNDEAVVEEAKRILKCESESCVYYQTKFLNAADMEDYMMQSLIDSTFMAEGPYNNDRPLTNFNIRGVMQQFASIYPNFEEIPFQMMDFMEQPHNVLRDFDFKQAFRRGKRTFAVIINTDKILPNDKRKSIGKHWFCLFMDFRQLPASFDARQPVQVSQHARRVLTTPACQIEYFNSSGIQPYREVRAYFDHVKQYFETHYSQINLWCVSANQAQQQYSDTQCGVYSLCYIEQRLKGMPYSFFLKYRVTDADMAKLRRYFFRNHVSNASQNRRSNVR